MAKIRCGVIRSVAELAALEKEFRGTAEAPGDQEKILLCAGGGCIASGEPEVKLALQKALREHGLEDRVSIVETGCLGPCSKGPVVVMGRDKTFYQKVAASDANEIVVSHLKNNRPVEHLTWKAGSDSAPVPVPVITDIDFFKRQTKIVLRNCGVIDPLSIEDYIEHSGYRALAKALTEMTPEAVIAEVRESGIRGRGGAGFPTAMKWQFAMESPGDTKYILCNADEGDPGAYMDRSVLEGDPHSVIEGMAIGAFAIGAERGFVYVRAEYPLAVERLQQAIDRARECGLLGENILGTGFNFDLEIRMGSGAFVCGEETALMASIEGKRGEPRSRPPFPAQKGLWAKPTVLNNVETFANIPVIVQDGGDAYAAVGTIKSKGTKVFALAGAVNNTGLVEVPIGLPLGDVVFDIGGGIPKGKSFKAAQLGGPSGGCIPKEYLNVALDYESLNELGAIMGSGGLIVMDEDSCMVDVARFFLEFVQEESCGKCVPCREGTKRMLEILNRICNGHGQEGDIEKLIEMGTQIKNTSLCGLGQTAANPVLSTIRHFRHEYEAHIKAKQCAAGVCRGLVRAPCQSNCPARVDIPGYISLMGEKRYSEALRLHRERNPFASVCARVCFHTCEERCRRSSMDEPVAIRSLKRFLVEQEDEPLLPEVRIVHDNEKRKVAIIGAGPAGLSCAYFLARMGYRPEIFEAQKQAGGMLVQAIPSYRLPREPLDSEIRMIEKLGVKITCNAVLGRDFTLESLQGQGYEAVFLGIGAPVGTAATVPGYDASGVSDALQFLREYNLAGNKKVGKKVVVVGGGNAAIDSARSALRLGADVTIVYRRTMDEMPAYAEEIAEAEREGVRIMALTNPVEILKANGAVKSVRCEKMKLGSFDTSGRRKPEGSGEFFELEADQVIFALGQALDVSKLFMELKPGLVRGSWVKADPITGQTSIPWVFAGGDMVTGPRSVVEAIGAGERAATAMDKLLSGSEHAFWRKEHQNTTRFDPDADPVAARREEPSVLPVEKRRRSFDEVERPWKEAVAVEQAQRCLRCDYGKECCSY
ncbi:MAG: NADH-quinone oxidoreductase subunit NuoF [Pontiellaceae bacterium]|jgi:NADH-quinone oxidoreductase subunit F|nr:NADH-quinone oxidoreductase subunit NuoF [Pontiellaceae bacterium]